MKLGAMLVLGGLGLLIAILLARRTPNTVSKSWRQDQQRRSWGTGIDQSGWRWPLVWRGVTWRKRS